MTVSDRTEDRLVLRVHHLLCIHFFEGHGYDDGFSRNMRRIIDRIDEDGSQSIVLTSRCDDICGHCPNKVDDRCQHGDSVIEKDISAAKFLGLTCEGERSANDLTTLVTERLQGLSDIRDICGECSWSSICNRHLTATFDGP